MRSYFQCCLRRWKASHLGLRSALLLAVLGVTFVGGTLGTQLLRAAASSCRAGDLIHTVGSGETLSGIAARYQTSWWQLASYNHLANANLIFPTQSLCIPQAVPASGSSDPARRTYVNLARQDAAATGISPEIYVRQINQESGFNPTAVSPAGAIGIAQFLPATARALGVNPADPVQALKGAAQLMAQYVHQYAGDYAKSLAAYNAGPGTVQAAVSAGGANWRTLLPAETQRYIRIILG